MLHPEPCLEGPLPICHERNITLEKKYVDDLFIQESIGLEAKLKKVKQTQKVTEIDAESDRDRRRK